MELKIVNILGIIAIFQSLILSVFFFSNKKGSVTSNRLFATLLFVFALVVSANFSNSLGAYQYFAEFRLHFFILAQTAFLIAPLLYLYINSLLNNNFALRRKDLLHTLPFFTALLFLILLLSQSSGLHKSGLSINTLYSGSLLLVESVYVILIFLALRKRKISLRSLFSRTNDDKLSLLRFFTFAFIIIWNVKFQSFVLLNVEKTWNFCPYTESIYFLSMFLFFNAIIFTALKKPELFSSFKKYETSELSDSDKENYKVTLLDYIESEKPYLDPALTLPRLSKKLSIHSRYLSQIINESFNKNFNDFINEYRINESKKLLREDDNGKKNMLEVAFSAGFNSKSSFYEAFKKNTGLTPREYKMTTPKRVKISLN